MVVLEVYPWIFEIGMSFKTHYHHHHHHPFDLTEVDLLISEVGVRIKHHYHHQHHLLKVDPSIHMPDVELVNYRTPQLLQQTSVERTIASARPRSGLMDNGGSNGSRTPIPMPTSLEILEDQSITRDRYIQFGQLR